MTEWLDDLDSSYSLRYYQQEAYDATMQSLTENRSTLIVMATGCGKTQVFCEAAKRWPGNVLVLAHRDELVMQARNRLEQHTGEWIGIEQAEWQCNEERIVVGSVQSVQQDKRLERLGRDRFSLIIFDEAHHAMARTYRKPIDFFSDAKVIGVTATPDRGDEKALGRIFDDVSYIFDIADAVNAGYLVPIRGTRVHLDQIDISAVSKQGGDLVSAQLDSAIVPAVEGIVKKTIELQPGRQGICFFPGVHSAELAAERFNAIIPGSAICIHANTDKDLRRELVRDYKRGRYLYLCNVYIASEGFDAPTASLVVQGRPTLSRSFYAQTCGRITRCLPGTIEHLDGRDEHQRRRECIARSMKPDCHILDFVGNSGKHTLMSPADLLGGNYSDDEVRLAKKKEEERPGEDTRILLEEARKELLALAHQIQSDVTSHEEPFSPFNILHINGAPDEHTHRFGFTPATPQQLNALKAFRVPEKYLSGLSKRQASKLITSCIVRKEKGLASYRQLHILKKYGVDVLNVSFERANEAIDYIANDCKWGRRRIDPKRIYQIVGTRREPGE